MVIFRFLGVFWSFFWVLGGILVIFRFWRYFGNFLVLGVFWSFFWVSRNILVIFWVSRVFWSFCRFWVYFGSFHVLGGILVIFLGLEGYFGHFLGFRGVGLENL